jgi:hypothetical protein
MFMDEDHQEEKMNQLKKIKFDFDGENYEIKIFHQENLINILAFKNNYPANGFRHQIQIPKGISVKDVLDQTVMSEYVELCKKDISERRWERLIEIKIK